MPSAKPRAYQSTSLSQSLPTATNPSAYLRSAAASMCSSVSDDAMNSRKSGRNLLSSSVGAPAMTRSRSASGSGTLYLAATASSGSEPVSASRSSQSASRCLSDTN
eukprot:Amastigsp_a13731_13.p3 type:complete len:106 gc:universal Amastigsp_a13731_13:634-317(-)